MPEQPNERVAAGGMDMGSSQWAIMRLWEKVNAAPSRGGKPSTCASQKRSNKFTVAALKSHSAAPRARWHSASPVLMQASEIDQWGGEEEEVASGTTCGYKLPTVAGLPRCWGSSPFQPHWLRLHCASNPNWKHLHLEKCCWNDFTLSWGFSDVLILRHIAKEPRKHALPVVMNRVTWSANVKWFSTMPGRRRKMIIVEQVIQREKSKSPAFT